MGLASDITVLAKSGVLGEISPHYRDAIPIPITSAINEQLVPTGLMVDPHGWRTLAMPVMAHMHSGAQPDGSTTPIAAEHFNT